MDLELTPLVWLDSKAAKLQAQISFDTLERLVDIIDKVDESDAEILDLLKCVALTDGERLWRARTKAQNQRDDHHFGRWMLDEKICQNFRRRFVVLPVVWRLWGPVFMVPHGGGLGGPEGSVGVHLNAPAPQ